jgi:hypothetical protein
VETTSPFELQLTELGVYTFRWGILGAWTDIEVISYYCDLAAYTAISLAVDGFEIIVSSTVNEYATSICTPVATLYNANLGRLLDSSEYTFDGGLITLLMQEPAEYSVNFYFIENESTDDYIKESFEISICDVTTFLDDPVDPFVYDLLSVTISSPRYEYYNNDPTCEMTLHLINSRG